MISTTKIFNEDIFTFLNPPKLPNLLKQDSETEWNNSLKQRIQFKDDDCNFDFKQWEEKENQNQEHRKQVISQFFKETKILNQNFNQNFEKYDQDESIIFSEPEIQSQEIQNQKIVQSETTQTDLEINIKEQNNNTKEVNLKILLSLLKKQFNGKEISEQEMILDEKSQKIFRSILKRKYKTLDFIDDQNLTIKQILNLLKIETSRKRPEENQKFIFKRTIKYLKKALKKKVSFKIKKKELENYFFNHYFKEIIDKQNLTILKNKDFNKSSLQNFMVPKTINNHFINLITKSKRFVYDFNSYLNNEFQSDYEEVIDFKLGFLFSRWEKQLEESQDQNKTINNICYYIEKNKKFKLPWNSVEIQEAIFMIIQTLI